MNYQEYDEYQEQRPLATKGEAALEYVFNKGRDNPELPWILTPYDVWYPNPFFQGDRGPHPESGDY
jgi:hypothetical protein